MARANWIRVSIYVASGLAALTLLIGLLHTPLGRPLLARLGVGCPVQASPEDTERARLESARATRGYRGEPSATRAGLRPRPDDVQRRAGLGRCPSRRLQ